MQQTYRRAHTPQKSACSTQYEPLDYDVSWGALACPRRDHALLCIHHPSRVCPLPVHNPHGWESRAQKVLTPDPSHDLATALRWSIDPPACVVVGSWSCTDSARNGSVCLWWKAWISPHALCFSDTQCRVTVWNNEKTSPHSDASAAVSLKRIDKCNMLPRCEIIQKKNQNYIMIPIKCANWTWYGHRAIYRFINKHFY
jgi:hypothetical protein